MSDYPYVVRTWDELPQGIRAHTQQSIDPDQPRVSIYCREASHLKRPWFVASFTRGNDGSWRWSTNYPMRSGLAFHIGDAVMTPLVADLPAGGDVMAPYDPSFRVRYALECGACGLRRTARSDGPMHEVFNTLWEADLREVTLYQVAARLR